MAHPLLIDGGTSSTVAAYGGFRIGYEAEGTLSLFVEFKSGKIYRYIVPEMIFEQMKVASSLGTYVNQFKDNYTFDIMQPDEVTNLIESAAAVRPRVKTKPKKKKAAQPTPALLQMYPHLGYFFA